MPHRNGLDDHTDGHSNGRSNGHSNDPAASNEPLKAYTIVVEPASTSSDNFDPNFVHVLKENIRTFAERFTAPLTVESVVRVHSLESREQPHARKFYSTEYARHTNAQHNDRHRLQCSVHIRSTDSTACYFRHRLELHLVLKNRRNDL